MKDFHTENYKAFLKKINKTKYIEWQIACVQTGSPNIISMLLLPKEIYRISIISINCSTICFKMEKSVFKFTWKCKGS